MPSFEFDGKIYQTDNDGYMLPRQSWTRALGEHLAQLEQSQIIMTDLHWEIVEFLQRYDDEYAVVLSNHTLTRVIFKKWGAEKGNTGYLYGLYPGGPATQAARIGGLTKPSKCI